MNRKVDLITDFIFGIVPAVLFQPLVLFGFVLLLGNTPKAFNSPGDFIEYIFSFSLMFIAMFGTAALIYGFYLKLRHPARSYNMFIKRGTFLGTVVCTGVLVLGFRPEASFAGALLIPTVWVGAKYWYLPK